MRKHCAFTLFTVLIAVALLPRLGGAQVAAPLPARLSFEVASVKPNKTIDAEWGGRLEPGRFTQTGVTLRRLIRMAYSRGISDLQMIGGPDWLDTDRFDVDARGNFALADYLPGRDGSPAPVYAMLRSLLAERFRLTVHNESRDTPIYSLVMVNKDGRPGPRLKRSDVDCDAMLAAAAKTGRFGGEPGQAPPCSVGPRPGGITAEDISMQQLANVLSGPVNRTVRDQTGLKGNFDVTLEWTPDELAREAAGIPIFTAIQEQLGLKLEPNRGPVDVLVIDRADHPAPD